MRWVSPRTIKETFSPPTDHSIRSWPKSEPGADSLMAAGSTKRDLDAITIATLGGGRRRDRASHHCLRPPIGAVARRSRHRAQHPGAVTRRPADGPARLRSGGPKGFLLLEWLASRALGAKAISRCGWSRSWPASRACCSFLGIARRLLSPAGALAAVVFFAVGYWPLVYTADVHPYGLDLALRSARCSSRST
jgi:hypothetical protein